jgi:hypothetical protein
MSAAQIAAVRRELLVRYLDAWTPMALHRSRRVTFAQAYAGDDGGTPEATLRVFGEFADLLPGRRLTVVVVVATADAGLAGRLDAAQRELGTPPELGVHVVAGDFTRLPVVLAAAGAAGAPVLTVLDAADGPAPAPATLAALGVGRPAEVLLALGDRARAELDPRVALRNCGYQLVTDVELVDDGHAELVAFGTSSGKSLDAFKNAMWAVDEYAGVRYRDPRDPAGHLLDISLNPHPGPLRRELLAQLESAGRSTVTELRQFTTTETVYRAADTTRVLTALLSAGLIARNPAHGRLSGDVVITPVPAAGGR